MSNPSVSALDRKNEADLCLSSAKAIADMLFQLNGHLDELDSQTVSAAHWCIYNQIEQSQAKLLEANRLQQQQAVANG